MANVGALTMTSLFGLLALARPAIAHCDTTTGPVVTAARQALEAGDASLVLHWVRPGDEAVVRSAFEDTMKVRALGPEAKKLSERYFFETLVRVHREGEGAPYTGLSEAAPEPIVLATDGALERGSAAEVEQQLVSAVSGGLTERFAAARAAKDFRPGDVSSGRAFVAAYVPLTHWVEGVFTAASGASDHHASPSRSEHAAHQALPWMLAGVLAIAVLVEGAFLVRRRRIG